MYLIPSIGLITGYFKLISLYNKSVLTLTKSEAGFRVECCTKAAPYWHKIHRRLSQKDRKKKKKYTATLRKNKLKYELPKTLPFPAWAWLMIFLSNKRFTNHLFFSLMPCPKVFRSYFRLGANWHSTLFFFFPSLVNKPFSLFNLPVLFPTHRYAYSLRVNIFSVYT